MWGTTLHSPSSESTGATTCGPFWAATGALGLPLRLHAATRRQGGIRVAIAVLRSKPFTAVPVAAAV